MSTAPDPLVWSAGALPKRRRLVHAVRDLAVLPGPPAIWNSGWFIVLASAIGAQDVADWHSVSLVLKCVAFMGSLHWPVGGADLGVGGVSFVEMLIHYELWAGERLVLEMSVPEFRRLNRPNSVSSFPAGPSIDIWRSCRLLGAMLRALGGLPGGLGRFIPCRLGANHCRLRRIGWERCGHGLTSRPRESASEAFLNELLQLVRYPPLSGPALLAGTLLLKYCAVRFASRVLAWHVPVSGHVACLVTAESGVTEAVGVEVGGEGVWWVNGSGPGRKRLRLNRKNPAHLAGVSVTQSRPRVWKRLRHAGHSFVPLADCKRRRYDQQDEGYVPDQHRSGVG